MKEARKRREAPVSVVAPPEPPQLVLVPSLFKATVERASKKMEMLEYLNFPASVTKIEDWDYSTRNVRRKFSLKTEKFLRVAYYDSERNEFLTSMTQTLTKNFPDYPELNTKTEENLGSVALDHSGLLEAFLAMYPCLPESRKLLDSLGRPEPEPVPTQKQGEESDEEEDEEDEDGEDDEEEELVTKDELDSILDKRFEKFLEEEFDDANDEEEIDVDEIKADVRKELEKNIEKKFNDVVEAASTKAVEIIRSRGVCPECGKPCGNPYNVEMHVATAHSQVPIQKKKASGRRGKK